MWKLKVKELILVTTRTNLSTLISHYKFRIKLECFGNKYEVFKQRKTIHVRRKCIWKRLPGFLYSWAKLNKTCVDKNNSSHAKEFKTQHQAQNYNNRLAKK